MGGYSTRDEALVLEQNGLQWDIDRLGNEDNFKYIHSPETRQWQIVLTAFDSIGNIAREQDIPVLLIVFPHLFNNLPWAPYKEQHT